MLTTSRIASAAFKTRRELMGEGFRVQGSGFRTYAFEIRG
jgi:hypothetical protein